ncbi:MAG: peptidase M48, partial [Pseudomonadales bacterium]
MDFFESQEVARRNTRLLIIFFGAAVLSLVAMTNLLVLMVANYQNSHAIASGSYYYSWTAFFGISGFVLAFIALGSLYRIVSLSKGGEAVAAMLGGKLLVSGGSDLGQ